VVYPKKAFTPLLRIFGLFVLFFLLPLKAWTDPFLPKEQKVNPDGISNGTPTATLQMIFDLNGDGNFDEKDIELAEKAKRPGANNDDKINGTEYLFPMDYISHGAWSNSDATAPSGTTIDDNAKELHITCGTSGTVWFDHPGIPDTAKLTFYRSRACRPRDAGNPTNPADPDGRIDFPFTQSSISKLPLAIYVRVEGTITAEVSGFLDMKQGTKANYDQVSMPLTIVRGFGDLHFFPAADRYIRQNNCLHYYAIKKYFCTDTKPPKSESVSVVVRREENTTMKALDAYRNTPAPLVSIFQVAGLDNTAYPTSGFPDSDEILNGCLGGDPLEDIAASASGTANGPWHMHSKFIGNLVSNYTLNSASESITGSSGIQLEGVDGRYIAMIPPHSFTYGSGIVPTTTSGSSIYQEAIGGFGSLNPSLSTYKTAYATNLIGLAKVDSSHRALFTVTYNDASGGDATPTIVDDAISSQCIPLAGHPEEISMFWSDGSDALAMALADPVQPSSATPPALRVKVASRCHYDYYNEDRLDVYLIFRSTKPDPSRH